MPPNKKEAVRTPKKTVFCGTASCYRLSRSSIITKTKHFIINNCHILANGQLYKKQMVNECIQIDPFFSENNAI